jgi:nucleotide-binding universal stress UspA family protein
MNRILFPTDLSQISQSIFHYTQQFAKEFQSEIAVLHAHSFQDDLRTIFIPNHDLWAKLSNFVKDSSGHQPDNVSLMMRKGKPVDEIMDITTAQQFRYIVMGKKKSYNVYRRIKGSKTSRITEKSELPVLVVPEDATYRPIRNILVVGANYRELAMPIQEQMLLLSLRFKANLHYFDILEEGIQWGNRIKQLNRDQQLIQKDIPLDLAPEVILEYIPENNIDLVVLLSTRKEILRPLFQMSSDKGDTHLQHIPMLVFNKRCQKALMRQPAQFEPKVMVPATKSVQAL